MAFAQAGHEVIFLFGTGTVLVGDPSQRDTGRTLITQSEIDENIKDWQNQVKPIVDFSKITIKRNHEWLSPLTLKEIVGIASHISAVQLFKRESFTRRIKRGDTVWYHETMYPLLQGYDSVVMDVDLEIGGTDQEFNMLIGRELQHKINHHDKFVMTLPMIMGTDGKTMSKTSGNCVWLNDEPNDMYRKLMGIGDNQIIDYLTLVTNLPMSQVNQIAANLKSNDLHPLEAKKILASAVVTELHSHQAAQAAQAFFTTAHQDRNVQSLNLTEKDQITLSQKEVSLLDILKIANLGISISQVKRTIEQGGVEYNGKKIDTPQAIFTPKNGDTIKFGKNTFKRVKIG